MDELRFDRGERIRLGLAQPFRIAGMDVEPAGRRVRSESREDIIEPRVMQVLVALHERRGEVVSRDSLIDRCWDGRIVGDDAVNRAVARLRTLLRDHRASASIETVARVGYRLALDDEPERQARPRSRVSRRQAVAATAALGAIAAGIGLTAHRRGPSPEARRLYEQGMRIRDGGTADLTSQAESFFRAAAQADPGFASAWGALALEMQYRLDSTPRERLTAVAAEARSAARRAVELAPDEPQARAALAMIDSPFRRWAQADARIRTLLGERSTEAPLRLYRARLLADLGQWNAAAAENRRVVALRPFHPGPHGQYVLSLWGAGRQAEAEQESERASRMWPRSHPVWFTRMLLLTYGGDPEAAVHFAQDRRRQPYGVERTVAARLAAAEALATRDPGRIAAVRQGLLGAVAEDIRNTPIAVRFLAASGQAQEALDLARRYLVRADILPVERVNTQMLFDPPGAALRRLAGFAGLCRAIALPRRSCPT